MATRQCYRNLFNTQWMKIGYQWKIYYNTKEWNLWTYVIEGLNCKEIIGTLYEKESQKTLLTVYYWKSNKEKKR